jgi:hypothetical protein
MAAVLGWAAIAVSASHFAAARVPSAGTTGAVPEFGTGSPLLTLVGSAADGLQVPRDLAFHPERPGELWTVNRANDGTVIYFAAGTEKQRVEARADRLGNHFMEEVSSIAFGAANTFATCQESRNTYNNARVPGNDFMGPTLWTADLAIYARVNQLFQLADWQLLPLMVGRMCGTDMGAGPAQPRLGSHIDMNHESPLCMGIAHDRANVYWVMDGLHGNVVAYDFAQDHGPGNDDHSDAVIRRYPEATFTRVADVPSHAVLDATSGWLYYADTGTGAVQRLDTRSGAKARDLPVTNEPVAEYAEWRGVRGERFASGLQQPSGIALHDGRLFVGDHATGEIIAYEVASRRELGRLATGARGLMGLEFAPDGRLWYVDGAANQLLRVDPRSALPPVHLPWAGRR